MDRKWIINSDRWYSFLIALFLIYANYNAIITHIISNKGGNAILLLLLAFSTIPYILNGGRQNRKNVSVLCIWMFFIFLILMNRNKDIEYHRLHHVARVVTATAILFMAQYGSGWAEKVPQKIVKIGFLNILATYFFLLIPPAYHIMVNFYGSAPVGTDHGMSGYHAGIANHYSQNGTYISFVFIVLAAVWIFQKTEGRKSDLKLTVLCIISLFALILTGKRGHFLFSIIALVIVYFVANPKQMSGRAFKIIVVLAAGFAALYISSFFVKPIAVLLQRFSTAGSDAQSEARFDMWALAWEHFKRHPILGIGWGGFKYQYSVTLYKDWLGEEYMYLNAHNVYVQLLCESGIVGFTTYLIGFLAVLKRTFNGLLKRKDLSLDARKVLYVSLAGQIFILIYNMTGNALYDFCMFFYAIMASAALCVLRSGGKREIA